MSQFNSWLTRIPLVLCNLSAEQSAGAVRWISGRFHTCRYTACVNGVVCQLLRRITSWPMLSVLRHIAWRWLRCNVPWRLTRMLSFRVISQRFCFIYFRSNCDFCVLLSRGHLRGFNLGLFSSAYMSQLLAHPTVAWTHVSFVQCNARRQPTCIVIVVHVLGFV